MLVVTRKLRESIVINDSIIISLLSIDANHVRIGIQAPSQIKIKREEVLDQNKLKANQTNGKILRLEDLKAKAANEDDLVYEIG